MTKELKSFKKRMDVMRKATKTLSYQGFIDILIYEDGSFVSPASGRTDIDDGVIGKWSVSGYKVSEQEQSKNIWIIDMLDSSGNFLDERLTPSHVKNEMEGLK